MSRLSGSARSAWIVVGAVLAISCMAWAIGPVSPDSAFVGYRYAEHLGDGNGPVFNVGDTPDEGYSNLPWVTICAALAGAGLALPDTAPVASVVFAVLCVLLLWRMLARETGPFSLAAVFIVYTASGPLAVAAASGTGATLEAFLLMALIAASTRAARDGGPVATALCIASGVALSMCGLEWNLALPAALAFVARHRSAGARRSARWFTVAVVIAALALVAWHIWRVHTFHQLVPPAWKSHLIWSADSRFTARVNGFAPWWPYYAALVLLAAAGCRARLTLCGRAAIWLLVASSPLLAVYDDVPVLARLVPLIGPLLLLASRLLVRDWSVVTGRRFRYMGLVAILFASVGCAMDARSTTVHVRERHDVALKPVAQWLAHWRPEGGVLATDIATVAYYLDWPTMVVGEAHPDVDAVNVVKTGPEYLVLRSAGLFDAECSEAASQIAGAPQLGLRYRFFAAIRVAWYEDLSMWVYVRRDLPQVTEAERETLPMGLGSIRRLGR